MEKTSLGRIEQMVKLALLSLVLFACRPSDDKIFDLLPPARTGITFANTITTNDSVNVQNDVYIYNGAGVAIGDVDNDGLPDIFFAGNQVSSRLYHNKGDLRFEDVTARAGVATSRWATGVTMVDINDDGWLDIYVSVSGHVWSRSTDRANMLFINNRDGTFTESAERYGIADTGFTTQSVFLDYDRDGCIDLFVLNNSPVGFSRGTDIDHPMGVRGETPGGYNQLYHNNCNGTFTNVSSQAGILRDAGYGLGVAIGDLNNDGWPDIYVSNDATPNDVLYVNNRDGTFTNRIDWVKHASFAGMGVDIADFNDDGWADIVQADMQPADPVRRKRMSGFMTYSSVAEARARGYREDYSVNSLQLSNGADSAGNPVFSEIARLAGVSSTDWSWSALFADFDNDGRKDLLITNGYPKAVNDFDYQTQMLSIRRGRDPAAARRAGLALLEKLPGYDVSNYVFRNTGNLAFTDATERWGMRQPAFSYGAAYGDLDNDGRLDLVVNNIDSPAFVYHNVGPAVAHGGGHWLEVALVAAPPHSLSGAIGATIVLTAGGRTQYVYLNPTRGFMSAMDPRAHFGLGGSVSVDSLEVRWPSGHVQVITHLNADTLVTISEPKGVAPAGQAGHALAESTPTSAVPSPSLPLMARRPSLPAPPPPSFVDYGVQPLLPYMISRQGPALATGDVNGDGFDDVFIGGTGSAPGRIWLGGPNGFTGGEKLPASGASDWGALFFDADGDGRPDLYVASGGYDVAPGSGALQDRLYVNRGGGRFVLDSAALPEMLTSTAAVRAGDFNGDGKPDLFVGGRLTPQSYPYPARSYILRNDGGRFTDVTARMAPDLVQPGGMVTDAAWVDFDGDGRLDLVTVGEWMPIQFFRNDGGRFTNVTAATGLPPMRGWWFSLASGDLDGDGRPDLVAGNLGLNYSYHASASSKFGVYAGNFSGSQTTDVILTEEIAGREFPYAGLVPLGRDIYTLGLRYPTFASFARASIEEVLSPAQRSQALHYQADTFASMFLHNDGGGRFSATPLPALAQIAPIRGIVVTDVDGDGHEDLVVAGNVYDAEPNTPRADAGNGLWLRGDGRGHFTPVAPRESGFMAPLNVSGLALARGTHERKLIVANTGVAVQVFAIPKKNK